MAEVFVRFTEPVVAPDGTRYIASACGSEMDDGRWQGWLEFEAQDGSGILRSARETTQPNRVDTAYWATGLTPVYLEGSLARALDPAPAAVVQVEPLTPAFDGPRPPGAQDPDAGTHKESVLNPFSVYRKGERLLRRQLGALAAWHLVNIIKAYELSDRPEEDLARTPPAELIELIVSAVRESSEPAVP